MSHPFYKRLLKEYKSLNSNSLNGIKLLNSSDDLEHYEFEITLNNPIYEIKSYKLIVKIGHEYPVIPPKVKFTTTPSVVGPDTTTPSVIGPETITPSVGQVKSYTIPSHPHIYSNGHICLNLLGDDWTPACSIESILISLQSMLNNNTQLQRPVDDERYTRYAGEFASKNGFVYHDDTV